MGLKPVFHNERRVWIWTIILLAGDTSVRWPGLATFLWYKPPPTDHWRAFNKTQSSNGQNRRFLPTIRQWQLYFIWSINLSLSYLQLCLCLQLSGSPSTGPGGIITNLNPRAQSLMDGLLDQICEILIPLSLRFSDSRLSSRGQH